MRALLAAMIAAVALAAPSSQAASQPPSPTGAVPAPVVTAPKLLDLNRATAAELIAVPGIGPATAAAIVELRANRGSFTKIEELLEVKGIGSKKLATLVEHLTVGPVKSGGTPGGVATK